MTAQDERRAQNPLCVWGSGFARNVFAAAGTVAFVAAAAFTRPFWWPVAGVMRRAAR